MDKILNPTAKTVHGLDKILNPTAKTVHWLDLIWNPTAKTVHGLDKVLNPTAKTVSGLEKVKNTVGKQSPWQLSFLYMSQVNLTVRTEPKLGKYLGLFRWVTLNIHIYAIVYGMKSTQFSII